MSRPPSRAAWLRGVERLAPGAVPLAERIVAAPALPGLAVNLADLDPDEAAQLALLRRLGCVRVFPSGDLGRWHLKQYTTSRHGVAHDQHHRTAA